MTRSQFYEAILVLGITRYNLKMCWGWAESVIGESVISSRTHCLQKTQYQVGYSLRCQRIDGKLLVPKSDIRLQLVHSEGWKLFSGI